MEVIRVHTTVFDHSFNSMNTGPKFVVDVVVGVGEGGGGGEEWCVKSSYRLNISRTTI